MCYYELENIVSEKEEKMPVREMTDARRNAIKKYDAEKVHHVHVRLKNNLYDTVKQHIDSRGEALNGFITRAIEETIERDKDR